MENIKYEKGIWTPFARVLCPKCHGNLNEEHCNPMELEEGNEITTCNKCGKEIQTYNSVANENNLVNRLKELGINAYMCQNGGMNSACEIAKKDNKGFYWITFGSIEDEYLIGSYDNEGDYLGEGTDFYCYKVEEMIEHVLSLKDIERL